jgi:TRAP transporter TAXI family solute receptor
MYSRFIAGAVALVAVLSAPAAQAQSFINVLTGGTSGVYYPLGVAIGKIFGDKIPSVKTQVQATKASVENLILLQQGRGELAFTLDKLRTIGAIYPNYIQIVATTDSGIKTLADLKGKSLSVGAPKSGTELNSRAILAAAGMTYKDIGKVEYLPFAESVDLMKNRQLNATLQSAGLGVASLKDLSTSTDITVVSVPKETVEKIGSPFVPVTIPANTYTGQDKDVPTAAVVNYLVTSSAVSADLAYQMTKVIYESLPELATAHAAGKEIKLETAATGSPVPLHPGAIRYYKEKGLIK